MSDKLRGKVAVITGGTSGIGLGTVELFVANGARVVALDLQNAHGQTLEERFPGDAEFIRCDVAEEGDIAGALNRTAASHGGIDVLFNNAGIVGPRSGVADTDMAAWNTVFAVNVVGPMLGMKHAVPLMRARGGGSIINTSSVAALQVGYGPYAYSVSKAALIQMTQFAVSELSAYKIRVNTICPGMIATPMSGLSRGLSHDEAEQFAQRMARSAPKFQPLGLAGVPADIAALALFLASDDARFITGACIPADGGLTIGPRHSWDPETPHPILRAQGLLDES